MTVGAVLLVATSEGAEVTVGASEGPEVVTVGAGLMEGSSERDEVTVGAKLMVGTTDGGAKAITAGAPVRDRGC
jgi:hypothetical protein